MQLENFKQAGLNPQFELWEAHSHKGHVKGGTLGEKKTSFTFLMQKREVKQM